MSIEQLQAENERLRAELERLRGDGEAVGKIVLVDADSYISMDDDVLNSLPIGTKLYTHPAPAVPDSDLLLDSLCDKHYMLGLKTGFQFGQFDDNDGLARAIETRSGAARVLKEIRDAKTSTTPQPCGTVPDCPYPCGWAELHNIATKKAAYFASASMEEVPDGVRSVGIDLGRYALDVIRLMLPTPQPEDK
jgi:hypothetical protein